MPDDLKASFENMAVITRVFATRSGDNAYELLLAFPLLTMCFDMLCDAREGRNSVISVI